MDKLFEAAGGDDAMREGLSFSIYRPFAKERHLGVWLGFQPLMSSLGSLLSHRMNLA